MTNSHTKSKIPGIERFLVSFGIWAYYCEKTGGFRVRASRQRGSRYYSAGDRLGSPDANGYLQLRVRGQTYYIAHLVWLWHHGSWPEEKLDHENQNPLDNRIQNLRYGGNGINERNTKLSRANKTGYCGVFRIKKNGRYQASVTAQGTKHICGTYGTPEEAYKARLQLIAQHPEWGFTDSHGV